MKVYEGRDIRNVALAGHGNSGKTSLTSCFLYLTGATNRLTRPDEGNTVTDFDEEEMQRRISISTGIAYAEWKKAKINFLDTPGFNIFMQETRASMKAADAALILVDGVAGVEVQTEKVYSFAEEYGLPRTFVVNKLDRERASFERAAAGIQEAFGRAAVPVQLPIGSEKNYTGVVDLIRMRSHTYAAGADGRGEEGEIPADMADTAKAAHERLVEMIAEGDDQLMEEFFEKGTLPLERIVEGLRREMSEGRIFPVLCASAFQNIGADQILDFALEYFPAPVDRPAVKAKTNGAETERPVRDSEPPAAFVFKTIADPFAGRVTYFKVLSGVIRNDDHLINSRSGVDERLAHVGVLMGKTIDSVTELHAGDIGAVAKLRDTVTGDTLAAKGTPVRYEALTFPEPSIAYAIVAKSRSDEDRMGNAIQKMLEEDQSLRFYRDPQTHEFLLAGNGQQHIEIVVSRMKRRYGVDVSLHAPKIPYRETIRGKADVQGRHKKQTGGHGQFGDCWIRMEPLPRGAQFEFANEVFGGSIPRNFIPAIEKGIQEAAAQGYLAGFPVVDFKVTVYDGSYHDVDSSEMAFKLAARKAFRAAMEQAKPALLEPIMNVEVHVPVEYAGDIMGDMNGRRGRIQGMDTKGGTQIVRAQVPMAEMLNYQNDLTSMTQGRGTFSMEFSHYDYVPVQNAEKIIAAAKAAKVGAGAEEEE
ncbi:MAG: elongation factor G [Acidobacteria bacterium]|nr:elongation factor G [Acidobacteriota bacterium]MBI3278557.1 elongation factor G [Acidobacteriota bacterium]